MSDSPNSNPPPNSPNRPAGDANGFNWRLLVLLGVASVILGLAFFGPSMNKSSKALTYAQFREAWDQGRIVTDDPKRPLKVVTSDSAYDAVIIGWENPRLVEPKDAERKRSDFQVRVNLDLQGDQISEILGDDVRMQQISSATESPLEGDVDTLSLAEFRRAHSLGQIKVADSINPLSNHSEFPGRGDCRHPRSRHQSQRSQGCHRQAPGGHAVPGRGLHRHSRRGASQAGDRQGGL
jgi:hypothetical protein